MLSIKKLNVLSKKTSVGLAQVSSRIFSLGTTSLFVGKNGSGKTSLLHGIFLHPETLSEREIFLGDLDISHASNEELFTYGLYYIPQHLITLSGVSFLSFLHLAYEKKEGKEISIKDFSAQIEEVCTAYGIPFALVQKNVHENLSGGERKLQELIQLLVLKPVYIFLDEIDAHLDMDGKEKVARVLDDCKKRGAAVIVVSHSFDFARRLRPDFVYEMQGGKVVRQGTSTLLESISQSGFSE